MLVRSPCSLARPSPLPGTHLQEEQKGTIDGELATVIASTSLACKQIASLVNRAGISNLTGVAGTGQNVQVGAQASRGEGEGMLYCNPAAHMCFCIACARKLPKSCLLLGPAQAGRQAAGRALYGGRRQHGVP